MAWSIAGLELFFLAVSRWPVSSTGDGVHDFDGLACKRHGYKGSTLLTRRTRRYYSFLVA